VQYAPISENICRCGEPSQRYARRRALRSRGCNAIEDNVVDKGWKQQVDRGFTSHVDGTLRPEFLADEQSRNGWEARFLLPGCKSGNFCLMGAFGIVAGDAGIFQKQGLHFGAQNSWPTGCVIGGQIRIWD
jgi:hypothetical protein